MQQKVQYATKLNQYVNLEFFADMSYSYPGSFRPVQTELLPWITVNLHPLITINLCETV